jgi:DNA-binding IclR family transcriptional regulator
VPVTDQAGVVRLIIAAHMFRGQFSDARQEDIAHRLQEIAARARQLGTINAFA